MDLNNKKELKYWGSTRNYLFKVIFFIKKGVIGHLYFIFKIDDTIINSCTNLSCKN